MLNVNSNYCARLNPWTLYDPVDPANQLSWLSKQLYKAEQSGNKVHITMHVPPDSRECTQGWLYNYIRIVERFQDIIKGQYYGHTHVDEFRIIYSLTNEEKPIGLEFIAPAITPFSHNNPAYRVYIMNSGGELSEYSNYYFNLTEANTGSNKPYWMHEYSSKEDLNLERLTPEEYDKLFKRIENSETEFNKFYR